MTSDRRDLAALFAIVCVAAVFRLPGLTVAPPPLNQDEASRGYDAWSILETGADRHGQRWPLFLKSFGPGDYTAALTTYLTVPFVAALGPTDLAFRLPDALFGTLTVLLLGLWLRRRFGSQTALLAAAILSLDPAHIALTRTAHESGFTPFFLVLAMLGLDRCGLLAEPDGGDPQLRTWPRAAWGLVGGLGLGLHTWAYPATRLFTPVLILVIVVVFRRRIAELARGPVSRLAHVISPDDDREETGGQAQIRESRAGDDSRPGVDGERREISGRVSSRWRGRLVLAGLLVGLLIGSLPLVVTALSHPERLAARAEATLIFNKQGPKAAMAVALLANWASNLDPRYLFLQCDDMTGIATPHVGQHLLVLVPLFVVGLGSLLARWRTDAMARLLSAWFVLYPVPAAICADWNPHPMRTVPGLTVFPVVAAVGGVWLMRRMRDWGRGWRRKVGVLAAAATVANVGFFARTYYQDFPLLSRTGYQTGLDEAMRFVVETGRQADFILVTNYTNQPYIYALLREPIPPSALARTEKVVTRGRLGFDQVLRVGRYYFAPRDYEEAVARFKDCWQALPVGAEGLVIDVRLPGAPPSKDALAAFAVGDPRLPDDIQFLEVRPMRIGEGHALLAVPASRLSEESRAG